MTHISAHFIHRRTGIGLKLVQSMEEWLTINGANYTFLATEENNVASTNLFTLKCNYIKFSSLKIFVQPVNPPFNDLSDDIKIEKLPINLAISYYKTHLVGKDIYPTDINLILEEKLSLGTWLCYFKEENVDITTGITSQSSWAIFSIWNTCQAYNLQVQGSSSHAALISHAKDNPKMPVCDDSNEKPLGFLFLYGLYGEGERLEELVQSLWSFALKMAENVKDCKAIITELGFSDPLRELVPRDSSLSCIEDIWYVKRVKNYSSDGEENLITGMRGMGNVFVDPRDF